ncbi:GNAT superfamily N-acetyltransferase [Rubricella aquisinus]|uniref:GNAT superfamily N-acetyltransferase n=1 Tax=Rubricella aquisinus TaxID=2028108 RepID=A0A840WJD5_9RHOB|nr:GNAT family N-acetyltransferase [Rubricella aquisinus]MBB5515199.1 GNAT superfamily N-acetyltransferase [Rubricella aquisinus]
MTREVEYVVTDLEMRTRPAERLALPDDTRIGEVGADQFLRLYRTVGGPYEWTDWLARPAAEAEAHYAHPDRPIYVLMRDGRELGFCVLDFVYDDGADLAYFGMMPDAVGQGLGKPFLNWAIHQLWDRATAPLVTVNTCTLDHPSALPLYQKMGFVPVGTDTRRRMIA